MVLWCGFQEQRHTSKCTGKPASLICFPRVSKWFQKTIKKWYFADPRDFEAAGQWSWLCDQSSRWFPVGSHQLHPRGPGQEGNTAWLLFNFGSKDMPRFQFNFPTGEGGDGRGFHCKSTRSKSQRVGHLPIGSLWGFQGTTGSRSSGIWKWKDPVPWTDAFSAGTFSSLSYCCHSWSCPKSHVIQSYISFIQFWNFKHFSNDSDITRYLIPQHSPTFVSGANREYLPFITSWDPDATKVWAGDCKETVALGSTAWGLWVEIDLCEQYQLHYGIYGNIIHHWSSIIFMIYQTYSVKRVRW